MTMSIIDFISILAEEKEIVKQFFSLNKLKINDF